ncbi:MAG TPA: SHOCT domain-containing protein [Lacunisphaera sp.]|nr:SHOCT domain-containing protein [Lacunisphaera sp.]
MKLPTSLVLIAGLLLLAGCETDAEAKIGMTEKQWLRITVLSDLAYQQSGVKAYKSNRQYYYFFNGVLVKIDPNWLPAQKIVDLNRPPQTGAPFDAYAELKKLDELRKSGVLTEEEFQAQKKKILDRKD